MGGEKVSVYPLPPLILLDQFNGNWNSYQDALYNIFLDSIVNKLTFLDLPVSCRYFQPIAEMHRCFWHLISEGERTDEERIPNIRRCERIRWIPHLINNYRAGELLCWENKRGTNKNSVLWLPSENYMIVLSRRNNYYLLTTAYIHDQRKTKTNNHESGIYPDPRKS